MNQNQDIPSAPPTYAEAMSTQQHDHHRTITEYGATSPSDNLPHPPTITSYPIPNPPDYSQPMPMPMPGRQPYELYDQRQHQQNQPPHVPPTDIQQPPVIHVIRHVAPQLERKKNSHSKVVFAFLLGLIVIAAILRMTIRHH